MQVGADAGARHAVQVVDQPVHGLRPSLHLLLRPPLRTARRPTLGRPLRAVDPREAEHRGRAPARARAQVVGSRRGGARHRHGSVPAGRREVPSHPCLPRRARRGLDAVLDRHARAARRPRHRHPAGGVRAGRRRGVPLAPDARRTRLADDRARHRAAREPARGDSSTRRSRHRRRRRHRADPSRALRRSRSARGGRARRARGGRADDLGERRASAARRPRALPRSARARLARGGRPLRGALRSAGVPERGDDEPDPRTRAAKHRCRPEPAQAFSPTASASNEPRANNALRRV